MIHRLDAGTPSAVGGLPHVDVDAAASLALALQPELPAAPQLPVRHAAEGILAQVSAGMPGVSVIQAGGRAGLLCVNARKLAAVPDGTPLHAEAWGGTLAFLRAAGSAGRSAPIKLQVAGPVTLGLALSAGGAKPPLAFAVASAMVRSRVRALIDAAATAVPEAPVVLVLDEPGLTAYPSSSFPLGADDTIDLLSGGLAAAGSKTMAGVHCCGPTDWRLVLSAGPDLISLPVDAAGIGDDAAGLSNFLDRGGWVAWGAVPTDRPLGDREEPHWRRLTDLWSELARNGCDPMRLRTQAIITPACGLSGHRPVQVPAVYTLVRRIAERVQDQAMAARMSAGA